jgi:protoporphyrinogen oxidase
LNGAEADVAVLGGGPAGLAAAHYALEAGLRCELFEASAAIGGNCRTLRFGDFRVDTGAHRLHDRDAATTALARSLLGGDLLQVDAPSQLYHDGRFLDFPLAPLDLLRRLPLGTIAAIARENVALRMRRGSQEGESFGALARATYGETLAGIALLEYSRKLWGRNPDELLPEVAGSRLARLDLRTFLVESFIGRRGARRHLDGTFLYPRLGIGQLFDALGERLGASVHLDAAVTRIEHRDGRITRIEIGRDRIVTAKHVINTLPLGLSARLLDPVAPPDVLASAGAIAFRHLRLCVVEIARERFSRNASIYFPDSAIPFTRLYEPKNRSLAMAPAGATSVVLEVPCETKDRLWQLDPSEFRSAMLETLDAALGVRSREVIDVHEVIVPNAYPILEIAAKPHVERLRSHLDGLGGMTLVGRNARFRYSSIHDMFRGARVAIDALRSR